MDMQVGFLLGLGALTGLGLSVLLDIRTPTRPLQPLLFIATLATCLAVLAGMTLATIMIVDSRTAGWSAPASIVLYGFAFWYLRRRNRLTYGIAEIIFAATVGLVIVTDPAITPFGRSFALIGAIYVAARGFDNIDAALGQPRLLEIRPQVRIRAFAR